MILDKGTSFMITPGNYLFKVSSFLVTIDMYIHIYLENIFLRWPLHNELVTTEYKTTVMS